jgi:hypothetical protein
MIDTSRVGNHVDVYSIGSSQYWNKAILGSRSLFSKKVGFVDSARKHLLIIYLPGNGLSNFRYSRGILQKQTSCHFSFQWSRKLAIHAARADTLAPRQTVNNSYINNLYMRRDIHRLVFLFIYCTADAAYSPKT